MNDQGTLVLFRAAAHVFALPIGCVIETMRVLPIQPLVGAPPFVLGLAIVRGAPIPVIDVAALIGGTADARPRRLVTVRTGNREVALAVESVVGVRVIAAEMRSTLPPLLDRVELVNAIGMVDAELMLVLHAGRIVPDEVWTAMAAAGAAT